MVKRSKARTALLPTICLLMIAAGNDAIFRRLCSALGIEDLADDPRFATNRDRVANRQVVEDAIEECTSKLSTDALLVLTREHDVPASAIQSVDAVIADPQVSASGMVQDAHHPEVPNYRDVSLPLRIDGTRPRSDDPPPAPGEHTLEVLTEIGFDDEEMESLLASGAVSGQPRTD